MEVYELLFEMNIVDVTIQAGFRAQAVFTELAFVRRARRVLANHGRPIRSFT
jgi:hypothetical protein